MKVKLYLFAAAVMLAAVFSGCKDDPIPPTVVTKPASGIAEGTATLNAEITNQGSDAVTSCGFYYNTSADMSYPEVVDANLDGSRFSSVISSLEPGKTYYYMAYAKSSAGMAEGEVLSFVTQAVKPTVETRQVSEVTTSGATLNAAIPSNGGSEITACGFYYSTSENMSNKATAEFTGTPDSLFSVAVSGLQSFTTYYYKAYAANALGSVEGEVMQFTTVIKPSVTTNAATDIYSASATLNGNVTNHGGTTGTIRGFLYGTSADNLADSVTSGTGSGTYSQPVAGLAPSTTYYFKAFASNSAGTVYGEVKQFATKAAVPPTVQTNAATAITATSATFGGNVTAAGNDPVTVRGFVWGTSSSNLSNNVEVGSGTGSFTKEITGLSHSTTYYYKAYATNAIGTNYGEVKQFTTSSPNMPTVQTNNASSITSSGATLNGNVTADGGATVTIRGFVYGTSASDLSQNVQSGSGTGSFTKALTGLSSSTTYYYKAYATNVAGTAYGEVKQFTTAGTTGTLNGHDWVDLGLPSGLRWATCNVGASTPTAYGNYYAWGETSTKSAYTEDNYTYSDNPTTLPSSADAATANWGEGWRMPTKEEMQELIDNCEHTWTEQNGEYGLVISGTNGNSIFLPAAGSRYDSELAGAFARGLFWSSSLYADNPSNAWYLIFHPDGCSMYYGNRRYGLSVRPVCVSQN